MAPCFLVYSLVAMIATTLAISIWFVVWLTRFSEYTSTAVGVVFVIVLLVVGVCFISLALAPGSCQ